MRRERVLMTALLILAVIAFLRAADAQSESDSKVIDTGQLHTMVVRNAYELEGGREKPYVIIDIRTKPEYSASHIFSAISIPEDSFERFASLFPKDKAALLVIYGNDAGAQASKAWIAKAAAIGYTNLTIYAEGFSVWKAQQLPVAPMVNGR
jgi:rhodanese-related sulfurtransferase